MDKLIDLPPQAFNFVKVGQITTFMTTDTVMISSALETIAIPIVSS